MKTSVAHCIRQCPLIQLVKYNNHNQWKCNHPKGFEVFAVQASGIPDDCPLRNSPFVIELKAGT